MVGRGTRTKDFIDIPKPLIEIGGKPLVQHCIESLNLKGRYIFIIREYTEYPAEKEYTRKLETLLMKLQPGCIVITLSEVTRGPADSANFASFALNVSPETPLVITNCDQALNWDSEKFLNAMKTTNCDGCVTTYPHIDSVNVGDKYPYSFIKLGANGLAEKVEEKLAISELMLNGIHYWKRAKDFTDSCQEMIQAQDMVNGEFYISKTYNYLINKGKKIIHYPMLKNEFFALGSTEEINKNINFLKY